MKIEFECVFSASCLPRGKGVEGLFCVAFLLSLWIRLCVDYVYVCVRARLWIPCACVCVRVCVCECERNSGLLVCM